MNGKKILFLGTHGQYNIGDELLLETFLSEIGPQHQYTVNSYDPPFTTKQLEDRYEVRVFHTTQDKWQLISFIRECNLLFFGGGSILKELYQSIGRNRYATLIMVLGIVTFANLVARKMIIMSNIGVGPITTKLGLFLAKLILTQVRYVSVRDPASYDICAGLGFGEQRLALVPDAVFAKDADFFATRGKMKDPAPATLRIALNLNYNIENPEHWDSFVAELARSLESLDEQHPIEIHALPMQSRHNPDNDLKMLNAFRQRVAGLDMVLHEPTTAQEAAEILARCDLFLGERLHALIMAAILGIPFVALVYDVKVREMVKYLGMQDFAIEIDEGFGHAALTRSVRTLTEQRHDVSSHLQDRAAELREQLQLYFRTVNEKIAAA